MLVDSWRVVLRAWRWCKQLPTTAFAALCDLHGQSESDLPDVPRVLRSLRSIRGAFAARLTHANDALNVRKGYCVDTLVR